MTRILVTIDRFEDDKTVLILPDGQTLIIDRNHLPVNSKPGDVLKLNFSASSEATDKAENKVKKLLSKFTNKESI